MKKEEERERETERVGFARHWNRERETCSDKSSHFQHAVARSGWSEEVVTGVCMCDAQCCGYGAVAWS